MSSTGKPVMDPTSNKDGEKCAKCEVVGESLLVCSVWLHIYDEYYALLSTKDLDFVSKWFELYHKLLICRVGKLTLHFWLYCK